MGKRIYRRFQMNPDGSRTYLNIEGEKRHHRTSVTRQRNGVPRVAQHERRARRRDGRTAHAACVAGDHWRRATVGIAGLGATPTPRTGR